MRSLTGTHNDVATGQTRPKPHRVDTRSLARCQYVAMPHPQHSAVLVLDIGIPSHSASGCSEGLRPQTDALLTRWVEHERRPTWGRVTPISGTCHLLWLIDYVYVAASSASTRLPAATQR